jgi:hypothetical protein
MDASGNAIAVWAQDDGTRWNVWASRYVAGSSWSTPEEIDDTDGDAQVPALAMNAAGEAVVVWRQSSGSREDVAASRYVPGSGWTSAELVENDDTGDAYNPDVAIDPDGRITAVLAYDDGSVRSVWANRYEPGTGWGTLTLLESSDVTAQNPTVAMDAEGNAWVAWEQDLSSDTDIWANRYDIDSGWQDPELLEIQNAGRAQEPRLVAAPDGFVIAVWRQWDGFRNNVWSNRYRPGTGWGQAEVIEDERGDAWWPRVDMDDAGNAMAVWRQNDTDSGIGNLSVWAGQYLRQ